MGFTIIVIFAIVVSVSKSLVYDPLGNGYERDYSGGVNGYIDDGDFIHIRRDELNKVDREKLLAIVSAVLQQDNNLYNPFTDLFTFKGNRGKSQVSWRKWLNWNKQNANLGT